MVKLCNRHGVAIVPRGAGTSLAGGCLPVGRGVVVMLTRMNRVLEIDLRNRMAVVEAGVPNLRLTQALAGTGYHFAPDPSSQGASTIGGNVATNAGGPHTLKYGVTVNHVLGVEAVLGDGSIVQLGPVDDPAGLDLIGLLVGSEGTLAIVTKVWVRLTPNPQRLSGDAGDLQLRRRRQQRREPDHRGRHHSRGHGTDGPGHFAPREGGVPVSAFRPTPAPCW